jgi:hypothetical protein
MRYAHLVKVKAVELIARILRVIKAIFCEIDALSRLEIHNLCKETSGEGGWWLVW